MRMLPSACRDLDEGGVMNNTQHERQDLGSRMGHLRKGPGPCTRALSDTKIVALVNKTDLSQDRDKISLIRLVNPN